MTDRNVAILSPSNAELYQSLCWMFTYKRPHGSRSEKTWINRFIRPLRVTFDNFGNAYKLVGSEKPDILWSCHTDTVHRKSGRQKIKLDRRGFMTSLSRDCLGADDGAGAWLMCEMIKAEKPGLYIFHRAEERGGLGSYSIAHKSPELLDGISVAIAFDRRGYDSIVTHQFGMCCSNEFAISLATELDMGHKPDPSGIFTDTANYTDIIPECTNISVGYENAHSKNEWLDTRYLIRLRDALLTLDTSRLVVHRQPGEDDYKPMQKWVNGNYIDATDTELSGNDYLLDLINDYPHEVMAVMKDYGIGADEILSEVWSDQYAPRTKRYNV